MNSGATLSAKPAPIASFVATASVTLQTNVLACSRLHLHTPQVSGHVCRVQLPVMGSESKHSSIRSLHPLIQMPECSKTAFLAAAWLSMQPTSTCFDGHLPQVCGHISRMDLACSPTHTPAMS